jgi:hypothetical protein
MLRNLLFYFKRQTEFFSKKKFFYLAGLLLMLCFFLSAAAILAEDDDDDECTPCCRHVYYTCSSSCGGTLTDVRKDKCCGTSCSRPTYDCEDWQKCDPSEAVDGKCYCDGSCLEKPKDPVYYNNPEYVHQPEHTVGNNDVKLPVKLEWTDVPGWKNKGGPGAHKKDPYGPQSYAIAIKNTTAVASIEEEYKKVLPESEFNSVTDGKACLFKSKSEVPWNVKACCNQDGTNCGPTAYFNFTTSDAPEPIAPYDPDWVGDKAAEKLGLHTEVNSLRLEWCAIPSVMAYKVLAYTVEDNKEECIPQLLEGATCKPYVVQTANGQGTPPNYLRNKDAGFFTKDKTYAWIVQACKGMDNDDCTDWSQKWKLKVNDFKLGQPNLYSPPNDPSGEIPVGLPVKFAWTGTPGSNSYVFELTGVALTNEEKYRKLSTVTIDYPKLKLDTVYTWRVKPCWDFDSQDCEDDAWSETYTFRITGRAPKTLEPEGTVGLPVIFTWENVPGAKSFIYHIEGSGTNLERTVIEAKVADVSYPDLKPEKTYTWKVKTCAREGGDLCGDWSSVKNVTIKAIGAPTNPNPADGATIYVNELPKDLTWDKVEGADAYKVTVTYTAKDAEEANDCPTGTSKERIVTSPGYLLSASCLGAYVWQVQSCFDIECKVLGGKSPEWTLNVKQNPDDSGSTGGLVVCGRTFDDPDTKWNERDACNIGHIFIMAQVIFEFFLFRVSIIVLVILTLITGVIFYTSLGDAATIQRVKSLWRAAGLGYLILLFGWLIVSVLLMLLGFEFGSWWKIKN